MAVTLRNLGHLRYSARDYEHATPLLEESLVLRRALGDKIGVADSLHLLGTSAFEIGDHRRAASLLREGLLLSRQIGTSDIVLAILESFAGVLAAGRRPVEATRLCAAIQSLRNSMGMPASLEGASVMARTLQATRRSLGDRSFSAAWSAGQALSLDEAAALVPPEG